MCITLELHQTPKLCTLMLRISLFFSSRYKCVIKILCFCIMMVCWNIFVKLYQTYCRSYQPTSAKQVQIKSGTILVYCFVQYIQISCMQCLQKQANALESLVHCPSVCQSTQHILMCWPAYAGDTYSPCKAIVLQRSGFCVMAQAHTNGSLRKFYVFAFLDFIKSFYSLYNSQSSVWFFYPSSSPSICLFNLDILICWPTQFL